MTEYILYIFIFLILLMIVIDYYPKILKHNFKHIVNYQVAIVSIFLIGLTNIFSFNSIIQYILIYIPVVSLLFELKYEMTTKRINEKKEKQIYLTGIILSLIYLFIVKDLSNSYYFALAFLIIGLSLIAIYILYMTIINKHHLDRRLKIAFIGIIGGLIIAYFTSDINWLIVGYTLSFINVYIFKNNALIYLDSLTGLYNRQIMNIENFPKRFMNKKMVLYYLDLNDFKLINDKYGHLIGDQVLMDVADILKKSIRKNDYGIRLGGDEFLLIVGLDQKQSPAIIKKRINQQLEFYNKRNKVNVSASLGYEVYNSKKGDFEHHLGVIDQKMYSDKNKR